MDAVQEAVSSSRDGVLPDDAITALVAALKEPGLEEPLRELRRQRLRKLGRAAADSSGRYTPLTASGAEGDDNSAAISSSGVGHGSRGGAAVTGS